ncbi:MAG: GNAT family N-acetyltransferase [Clostridiales bacterium]|nr:GNAT family N-acetyltransferase [Clostridiales bacterium]
MEIKIQRYTEKDINSMKEIWNEVVRDGIAFPQTEELDHNAAEKFFAEQSYCGAAVDSESGRLLGMYILHPNNVGRCGHISNASYAVASDMRGRHVGEALVKDCIIQARRLGFRILQFNAVVATNTAALELYKKLGFTQLGVIPGGFHMPDGTYEDIIPHYICL